MLYIMIINKRAHLYTMMVNLCRYYPMLVMEKGHKRLATAAKKTEKKGDDFPVFFRIRTD